MTRATRNGSRRPAHPGPARRDAGQPAGCDARARAPRAHQEGSAYIVALLALLVLTLVGLSLALVTQTEMQIGANERTIQKVFYAADSGFAASTAKALVNADYAAHIYTLPDADASGLLAAQFELDASPFLPILQAPCNLCEINNAGEYGAQNYQRVNHALTIVAGREAGAGIRLAERTLAAMVDVQPWQSPAEALLPLNDPTELAKIKF